MKFDFEIFRLSMKSVVFLVVFSIGLGGAKPCAVTVPKQNTKELSNFFVVTNLNGNVPKKEESKMGSFRFYSWSRVDFLALKCYK